MQCHPRENGDPVKLHYYVYILASKRNGTLYIRITNNLLRRSYQHKVEIIEGFTQKYKVNKLVYFESYDSPKDAIQREKKLKKWNREWKIELIESKNPKWEDLSINLLPGFPLPSRQTRLPGIDNKNN